MALISLREYLEEVARICKEVMRVEEPPASAYFVAKGRYDTAITALSLLDIHEEV